MEKTRTENRYSYTSLRSYGFAGKEKVSTAEFMSVLDHSGLIDLLDFLNRADWYKLPYLQDKSLSREQKITLKEKCASTMVAKQTLDALGWEFDAAKSRDEQVKGS